MRSVLVAFLACTCCALTVGTAHAAPSREQTLEYINALFGQLDNQFVHFVQTRGPSIEVFNDKTTLNYDKGTKVYTLRWRFKSKVLDARDYFDGERGQMIMEVNRWVNNLPIKRIVKFEHEGTDVTGVGRFCVYYDTPFQDSSVARMSRWPSGTEIVSDGPNSRQNTSYCPYYSTLDQDNFRRLKNAFLRLKEIELEEVDPFLD